MSRVQLYHAIEPSEAGEPLAFKGYFFLLAKVLS
jgi:hypothetical protein